MQKVSWLALYIWAALDQWRLAGRCANCGGIVRGRLGANFVGNCPQEHPGNVEIPIQEYKALHAAVMFVTPWLTHRQTDSFWTARTISSASWADNYDLIQCFLRSCLLLYVTHFQLQKHFVLNHWMLLAENIESLTEILMMCMEAQRYEAFYTDSTDGSAVRTSISHSRSMPKRFQIEMPFAPPPCDRALSLIHIWRCRRRG